MSTLLPVYPRDLVIVSGKGSTLVDAAGRTYLDCAAGVAVNGLGYGDAAVLRAIREQSRRLIHASNLYHHEPGSALAKRLVAASFPSRVFFCNSGTEAIEASLKFARRIGREQGRTGFVALEGSFHGRTMGALSITATLQYREPFEPLIPGVRFCARGDLDAASSVIGDETAAVIVEPVQGEGGIHPLQPEFLQGLARLCRERGALLVFDEIQCGLGRTGRLFAYEHAGVTPDVLVLAKPLGGGLPLGAVLLREALAGAIRVGDHGSTFGGNPVACAASLAVLDHLTHPGFLDNVERRAAQLRRGLGRLARRHASVIKDVRGVGLMLGVELHRDAAPAVAKLRERGVLATRAGANVLRLVPPLVIRAGEVRVLLEALDAVLAELGDGGAAG